MSDITVQEIIHLLPTVNADWHERAVAFLADLGKDNCSTANVCVQMMEEHTELRRQLAEAEERHGRECQAMAEVTNRMAAGREAAEAKLALAEQDARRYRQARAREVSGWLVRSSDDFDAYDAMIDAAIAAGEGRND